MSFGVVPVKGIKGVKSGFQDSSSLCFKRGVKICWRGILTVFETIIKIVPKTVNFVQINSH